MPVSIPQKLANFAA